MNRFLLLTALFITAACNSNKEPKSEAASAVSNDTATVTYPLPSLYSPTWQMDDTKNAVTVLNIIKDWMAGNLESFPAVFADSVSLYLADGSMIVGSRDTVLAQLKNFRSLYSELKGEIYNIIPLRHGDTKENWVCIWMKEVNTTKQGKKDSVQVQETWRFNKEGKADLVYQYAAAIVPPKK